MLDVVDRTVPQGLVTLESRAWRPVPTSRAPSSRPARARGEADRLLQLGEREVVGAAAARGRDGRDRAGRGRRRRGRRRRMRLFQIRGRTPMIIISVGPPERLARAPAPRGCCRSGGDARADRAGQARRRGARAVPRSARTPASGRRSGSTPGPEAGGPRAHAAAAAGGSGRGHDGARRVGVLQRRAAVRRQVRAHHEPPAQLHVYIDRPHKVAENWPMIDELTAEHGIVTSLLVPGYREVRSAPGSAPGRSGRRRGRR